MFSDRAEHKLDPRVDRDQAGGRDREVVVSQVYGIHDEASGKFRHPQTEKGRRIRHQVHTSHSVI